MKRQEGCSRLQGSVSKAGEHKLVCVGAGREGGANRWKSTWARDGLVRLEYRGSFNIQKLQKVWKAKAQKIPGDLGAQDSAGVAKDLVRLVNKSRENTVLPTSSDCLLRPGSQNTASASPHSVRWQVQYSAC